MNAQIDMSLQFQKFKALHQARDLFVLPNAWNARSAKIFQEREFPAIATSSAAVADSLGYEDGEQMPFAEYLFVINRIQASLNIPLTVDMEMGYGKTSEEIFANILNLLDSGVVGINIEDSVIHESNRSLRDPEEFAGTIRAIKNKLASKKRSLFVNIRCDTYILNVDNKQQETKARLKIYEGAGADGIFLPCICQEADIAEATTATKLPLNVMCIPGLPGFDVLNKLGVKRVSMGPFLYNKIYDTAGNLAEQVTRGKTFLPILSSAKQFNHAK